MYYILLLKFSFLIENSLMVFSHDVFQPYGPAMCEMLCKNRGKCSSYSFDEIQLSCRLISNTSHSVHVSEPSTQLNVNVCNGRKPKKADLGNRGGTFSRKSDDSYSIKQAPVCDAAAMKTFYNALTQGRLGVVKRVLSTGLVNVNCSWSLGLTALMIAARHNQKRIFDFLLHQRCDLKAVDDKRYTVLHHACIGGNMYIVKTLLDKFVLSQIVFNIESRGFRGRTALMGAIRFNHKAVVNLLVERGADVNSTDDNRNNILHYACRYGHIRMVKYIFSLYSFDLEAKAGIGITPLMAAVYNDKKVVKFLVKHNAVLTSTDSLGYNILHIAADVGKIDMVKYLITLKELRGFEQRQAKDGNTPVQVAEMKGHYDIVSVLKLKQQSQGVY